MYSLANLLIKLNHVVGRVRAPFPWKFIDAPRFSLK